MPSYSTSGHALQFGTNNPTVSIYGTNISGYIVYQTSGSFYQFAPGTKYFALEVIFDSAFSAPPYNITLTSANASSAQSSTSSTPVEFFVDGGNYPGGVTSDITSTSFKISGISSSVAQYGPQTFTWYYNVAVIDTVSGSVSLTGGSGITLSPSTIIGPGTISPDFAIIVDKTTAQTLTNKTLTTPIINGATSASGNFNLSGSSGTFLTTTGASTFGGSSNDFTNLATFNTHINVDGYLIDLSGGATDGQALVYDTGTNKFRAETVSGGGGSETLAATYALGANQASTTLALDNTRGGLIIGDNTTPITNALFTVQNDGGPLVTYFSITPTYTLAHNRMKVQDRSGLSGVLLAVRDSSDSTNYFDVDGGAGRVNCNFELWVGNGGTPGGVGNIQASGGMSFNIASGNYVWKHNNNTTLTLSSAALNTVVPITAALGVTTIAPSWIAVTYNTTPTTWNNFGGVYSGSAYYKDALGIVHVRVAAKDGTAASTIFTLPTGYRPGGTRLFAALSDNGSTSGNNFCIVAQTGEVSLAGGGTTNAISTLIFAAEN